MTEDIRIRLLKAMSAAIESVDAEANMMDIVAVCEFISFQAMHDSMRRTEATRLEQTIAALQADKQDGVH